MKRVIAIGSVVLCVVFLLPLWAYADGTTPTPAPTVEPPVTAHCADFPSLCVPLVGELVGTAVSGVPDGFEAPQSRLLDGEGDAAPGVVRGVTPDGFPFLGDPNAPVRLRLFENFTCVHCQDYHEGDLSRFVQDYVLTGQAVLEVGIMAFGTEPYSTNAAFAALCAGDQGAFWEMHETLWALLQTVALSKAFDMPQFREFANALGLDGDALASCVETGRYADMLDLIKTTAYDLGVNATPWMLIWKGDAEGWKTTDRSYDNLAALTDAAHAQ